MFFNYRSLTKIYHSSHLIPARALPRNLCIILAFFTFTFLQPYDVAAQNAGQLTVGQSLKATKSSGSSLLSPSGDFAFGFHQLNSSSGLFLLAIWYAKIPDTIVWYANDGYPVPEGSTVSLTADEGLVLTDRKGNQLWNTSEDLVVTAGISYGFMNDTGDFMIKSSSSDILWESFKQPTDTLLPTQIMDRGGVLTSRRSETNFTKGRFQLRFLGDTGNLVLNTREPESGYANAPYATGTLDEKNQTISGQQLVYNESGYMYMLRNDGSVTYFLSDPASVGDNYQRATMEVNGMLTWYYHPRNSTGNGWAVKKMLPTGFDICQRIPDAPGYPPYADSGICGYNNMCSQENDGVPPTCQCLPNYSLQDPNDKFGNCKPQFMLPQCDADSTALGEHMMVKLEHASFPFNDYAKLMPMTAEECKISCVNDCFCAVAIFGDPNCWKKRLPLSYGVHETSISGTTYLKVGNSSALKHFISASKRHTKLITVLSALLGSSALVNFFLLSAIGFGVISIYCKKRFRVSEVPSNNLRKYSSIACFSFKELKEATNEFKEEIGRGAFGVVYKGIIGTGGPKMFVAVKKLDRLSNGVDKEFETEVNVIGQTHHKNLVRLIGFCKEEDQRLLVYEYMSNGTLADYLFGEMKPSWSARIQIIHGVTRGLLYLHEECGIQIIHCDIKPQNILLDDHQNVRISDFGLAKLLVLNQTHTNTAIRGTKGYVAPEWFRNKPVTAKVDVYSFGVLLLEIICCRRSVHLDADVEEKAILTDWAFDCYQSKNIDLLVNDDMEALNDRPQLVRFLMVALWCIQEDPGLRPTMRMVAQMLEGLAEVPYPPCPASFSVVTFSNSY